MGIATWVIGKVTGGMLGKLFGPMFDIKNQRNIMEAGLLKESVQADLEINRMKMQMATIHNEWWVTRWIMPAFAYPIAFHFGAVILDSVFLFEWDVAALPGPMAEWEGQIILSFFIIGTAERMVSKWVNKSLVGNVIENVKAVFSKSKGGRSK